MMFVEQMALIIQEDGGIETLGMRKEYNWSEKMDDPLSSSSMPFNLQCKENRLQEALIPEC